MFFSAKQLLEWDKGQAYSDLKWQLFYMDGKEEAPVTLSRVKKYVAACKKAIVERKEEIHTDYDEYISLWKWYRPWQVIPELKNFSAPDGEYAIGIEVEMGFVSQEAASKIASKVQHWKNIALDFEGGSYPIEATFPPFLYSKLSSKCQPIRYLKLLQENSDLVEEHGNDEEVGIHVNVSKGGSRLNGRRVDQVSNILRDLNQEENDRYFGRYPYSYANCYEGNYIEFKLFNSTTDPKVLRRYIHIAVALSAIIYGEQEITTELVLSALSTAYNKR